MLQPLNLHKSSNRNGSNRFTCQKNENFSIPWLKLHYVILQISLESTTNIVEIDNGGDSPNHSNRYVTSAPPTTTRWPLPFARGSAHCK
jgi:hypothetical protein